MKITKSLASLHAYLCADGYVVKNPETQKSKYYRVGLRNTDIILLKDFQKKFEEVFNVTPWIKEGQISEKGSREIYEKLTKHFGSFYSREWSVPELDIKYYNCWLRTFFDCEGWAFCKTHQNRHIGVDSINEKGIDSTIIMLNELGIKTIKKINKKRKMYRILIYGKENLKKFKNTIGFLHPEKSKKLENIMNDFVNYHWEFPAGKDDKKNFIIKLLKEKSRVNKIYIRIISKEESNLRLLKDGVKNLFNIHSTVRECRSGIDTKYFQMSINKKVDVRKLVDMRVIPNVFKDKGAEKICIKKN